MKVAFVRALAWIFLGAAFAAAAFILVGSGKDDSVGQELAPSLLVNVLHEVDTNGISTTVTAEVASSTVLAPASGLLTDAIGGPVKLDPNSAWNCGAIDGRPVICAASPHPIVLWRELKSGTRGDDVLGLQEFLHRRGYLEFDPDGVFGRQTETAFQTFREDITGTTDKGVWPGDLVVVGQSGLFEPSELNPGQVVGIGDSWGRVSEDEPTWYVAIPPGSFAAVSIGDTVEGDAFSGTLESFDSVSETGGGQLVALFRVSRTSGGIQGVVELTQLRVVVGSTTLSGTWVPTAAIATDGQGTLFVVDGDERRHQVTLVSDQIVDGRTRVEDSLEAPAVVVPNPSLNAVDG